MGARGRATRPGDPEDTRLNPEPHMRKLLMTAAAAALALAATGLTASAAVMSAPEACGASTTTVVRARAAISAFRFANIHP